MIAKSLALFLLFSWPSLQEALAEQVPLSVPLVTQNETLPLSVNEASALGTETQLPAETHLLARMQHCFDEIDQAIQSFENGRADIARTRLSLLTQSCSNIPHLFHNLGAIAILERDWSKAIGYFEQSLSLDTRASMTQKTLTSIYQYKATLAYKSALNLSGPEAKIPIAKMQSSDLSNSLPAHSLSSDKLTEHSSGNSSKLQGLNATKTADIKLLIDEVRFEVSSWWQAQQEYDIDTYFAYYSPGVYPAQFRSRDQWSRQWDEWQQSRPSNLAWTDIQFEVEPLDDYMLVSLQFHAKADATNSSDTGVTSDAILPAQTTEQNLDQPTAHTLLVLQKIDLTWQIIKEKSW